MTHICHIRGLESHCKLRPRHPENSCQHRSEQGIQKQKYILRINIKITGVPDISYFLKFQEFLGFSLRRCVDSKGTQICSRCMSRTAPGLQAECSAGPQVPYNEVASQVFLSNSLSNYFKNTKPICNLLLASFCPTVISARVFSLHHLPSVAD